MARPRPLSGYPEYSPAERIVEQQVLDGLRRVFELHGFASVETRAVEPLSQLLRKGEIDKEVYVVRRLHEAGDAEVGDDTLALHFDLTVPFARYVVENSGTLQFPFKRYQVQKVWRGERPQEGRYREFCQADIDVVGRDVLPAHYEAEMALVMSEALTALPLPPLRMQVNNRKLIEGFFRGVGASDPAAVMQAVDKLDKVGAEGVRTLLTGPAGLDAEQAEACLALAAISGSDPSVLERVRALGVQDPLLDEGIADLGAVLEATAGLTSDRFSLVADLSIARGLDYYTGTVYEMRMEGFESLGSICSGGRYDALASDGKTTYPGVGISFGVTRALAPLLARGVLTASRSTPTCVLVALGEEAGRPAAARTAAALRARGIATEVSPDAAKFGKQIRFAERRGIPFVWFAGAGEDGGDQVRDIRSGEQVDADASGWAPPAADLRPAVVRAG
ncbi:histidine--tRNA ligase [Kineococcus rubinsiae]|uniref:histidine--tRNA ligase n=1 Tax=Kineococcus rubinsiae TaxID=2609562 RepID=UPI00143077B7|nr:histidine--tRNA ligase [Kineococcus rubinsiae]NIZ89824.1 histidine--tRNA ligase [Kineococcus rubinsiae]